MAKKSEELTGIKESTTKEKILKKVRNALITKLSNPFTNVDFNSPIYKEFEEEAPIQFVMNLKNAGGTFVYCENEKAVVENLQLLMKQKSWASVFTLDEKVQNLLEQYGIPVKSSPEDFKNQVAGITRCDYLIARFGSVMVSSGLSSGRKMFGFPESHLVIASMSQVVPELKDGLREMKKKYADHFPSQVTVITGPSRTADIEKTLVMGAHGPKELYVFMVDDL